MPDIVMNCRIVVHWDGNTNAWTAELRALVAGSNAGVPASGIEGGKLAIPAALQSQLDTRLQNLQTKHGADKVLYVQLEFEWGPVPDLSDPPIITMTWIARYTSSIQFSTVGLRRHGIDSAEFAIPANLLTWLNNRLDDVATKYSATLRT